MAAAPPRAGDVALAALSLPRPGALRPRPAIRVRQTGELIGLDRTALAQQLGEPDMLRRDTPAEIWQYRSPTCVLSVFLYAEGTLWRVTYVDIGSPRGGPPVAAAACLSSLSG